MTLTFMKTHSCGSNYIVINTADCLETNVAEIAGRLCMPPFGVGADGLAVVQHLGRFRFTVQCLNPDGTDSPADGEALRCCARTIEIRYGYYSATLLTGGSTYESRIVGKDIGLRLQVSPDAARPCNPKVRNSPGAANGRAFVGDFGRVDLTAERPSMPNYARSRPNGVGTDENYGTAGLRVRPYGMIGIRCLSSPNIRIETQSEFSLNMHAETEIAQGNWLYSPATLLFEGEFPWP
jgi:hypothetical protein